VTRDPAGPAVGPAGSVGRTVLLGWLLACVMLCLTGAQAIARFRFADPDDVMRLMQVRDWMAGQSWWDVTQYRLGPAGHPFAMHWSRLVDLPLAGVLALADLFAPRGIADRIAATAVPLATLLCAMALVAGLARRVLDAEAARWAVLLLLLSPPVLIQMRPMRIDHHGWQVVLALAAALLLLRGGDGGRTAWRRGAGAGLALAALVTVSLEGLPVAAALLGCAALFAAWTGERGRAVAAAGLALPVGALVLHLATRGPFALAPACDAVSPAWLLALAAATPGLTAAGLMQARAGRLAGLVVAGAAAAGVLVLAAPQCLAGPFASLDPLVRVAWYENVVEGLPAWRQPGLWGLACVALPLVGLAGAVLVVRRAPDKGDWPLLLAWAAALALYAFMVNRASATANAFAVPGAAALLMTMLTRARAIPGPARRLGATAGALALASPGALLAAAPSPAPPAPSAATARALRGPACDAFEQVRVLGGLAPGLVLTPVDVSPDLVIATRHRAVGAGYHRDAAAIALVMRSFTSAPERAERYVRASGATYVAGCRGWSETNFYAYAAPDGLWARLARGERVPWLERVAVPGAARTPVMAWRVLPEAPPRP